MPSFADLREFITELEKRGDLVRITAEIDPNLEMTEIADAHSALAAPPYYLKIQKGRAFPYWRTSSGQRNVSPWAWEKNQ